MARKPEGIHIRWRSGIGYCQFSHAGRFHSESTGERDPQRAQAEATRIWARVVGSSGRAPVTPKISRLDLAPLTAQWVADLEATHDARTAHEYDLVAQRWCERWKTLGDVTELAIADYTRDRLREVTRETTRKNLVSMRSFLGWCKERGLLDAVPETPKLSKRTTGVRARAVVERVPLTVAQAKKLIAALPVLTKADGRPKAKEGFGRTGEPVFRVRDWATVAWETSLRPSTLAKLRTPEHFRKGDRVLRLTDDIDKARFARDVPLSKKAREALERSLPEEPGRIFGSHDYREALEAAGKKSIKRAVSPYDLRHSRITAWVRDGKDLLGVQFLAGHKDLTTTARYAHARAEAARKVLGVRR